MVIKKVIKYFRSRRFWRKCALIGSVVLIGTVAAGGAYFILAPSDSLLRRKIVQIFALPAVSVDRHKATVTMLDDARNSGAHEPLDFLIKQTATQVLAEREGIYVSEQMVERRLDELLRAWNLDIDGLRAELRQKNISYSGFIDLYVKPELYRHALVMKHNAQTEQVRAVNAVLRAGASFADTAARYSQDSATAPLGGEVGFVTEQNSDPLIWAAAAKINDGEWTGPINTSRGYVFVKRIFSKPATATEAAAINLQLIMLPGFAFEPWLDEQIKRMVIKSYVK